MCAARCCSRLSGRRCSTPTISSAGRQASVAVAWTQLLSTARSTLHLQRTGQQVCCVLAVSSTAVHDGSLLRAFAHLFLSAQESVVAVAAMLGEVRHLGWCGTVHWSLNGACCASTSTERCGPQSGSSSSQPWHQTPCSATPSILCAAGAVGQGHVQLLHGARLCIRPAPLRRAAPVRHQIHVGVWLGW